MVHSSDEALVLLDNVRAVLENLDAAKDALGRRDYHTACALLR